MTRILVSESSGMSTDAVATLGQLGEVVLADLDRGELLESLTDVDVLWVRLRTRIDAEVFSRAPQLGIVATATTGLDHVDLETARTRGIEVVSLRGATEFLRDVRATAELTIGLVLSLLRNIPAAVADVREGRWDRDRFKGRELRGSRIGIVGYGRLGSLVAGYFRSFGASLIASDPYVQSEEIRTVSLDELLSTSDIITIHASLTSETHHLIGREQLARCKPGALLINTARGDIVDSAALLDALRFGQIAGAALDVLAGETSSGVGHLPLVDYARGHANLIITPHIGGCTHESMAMTENYIANEIARRLKERP
jgi:D-3-phosphoglycerate dehydrogenase